MCNFRESVLLTILLPILIRTEPATAAEHVHHSSRGGYHAHWKEFGPCPAEKRGTNEIFTDIRLTKRRRGMTEIIGKYILEIPLDDSVTVNVNFAVLGSNSAWLPNAYNIQIPRACTSMYVFLQEGWTEYTKNMGMSSKCPVAKGTYEFKGFDLNKLLGNNPLVKEFFYGRYKITMDYLRFKKLVGCTYTIVELVPGWQRESKRNEQF